jgi:hypothetical protein
MDFRMTTPATNSPYHLPAGRLGGWRRAIGAALCGATVFLAACEGDFIADPNRPRPTRAVRSMENRGDALSETMRENPGGLNLFSVDFANKKDEQPTVRTILDPLREARSSFSPVGRGATPATRPAGTQPADGEDGPPAAAALAPGALPIRVVDRRKPADQVSVATTADGAVVLTVLSPSGIGDVTLERTGDTWPKELRVALLYATDKPFTTLEGFNAQELLAEDRTLSLKATAHPQTGTGVVTVPAFSRSSRIHVEWVDAYRR